MSLIYNKKAHHDYSVVKTYQAGVALSGGEVKSLRQQKGSLTGSFVKIMSSEVYLINAQIPAYAYADQREYDPKRTRKLLLKKKEIDQLQVVSEQKGSVLIPLSFDLVGRYIKLTLGVGRGKKQFEKRAEAKKRDIEREVRREMKDKIRLK